MTFSRDVAPIVLANCSPCHRPAGSGPFSLTTYGEVRARGKLIVNATRRRYMPPWKPDPEDGGGPFAGARHLSSAEIDTIARWVDQGMVEGDPRLTPPMPAAASDWLLGKPDLVVTLPEPFTLPADGPDLFRIFVVRVPVAKPMWVSAVEFRPGTSRAVHHANLRFDQTAASRELDATDSRPGYEGAMSATARYPDGYFLGWTPGQRPQRSSPGMAWRLEPGSDLVLQLHLRKTGKPERIQPSVGFVFTDDAPARVPLALRLGHQNIDLAPGARTVVRDSYQTPVDIEVHSIHPHAHYRATDVNGFAELPDGTRRSLIHISDWDFNWQDIYQYETPIALPRGTVIGMEYTFDNSDGNPRNPDRPARHVRWGQNSSDEMGDLWLQVVTRTQEDRLRLVRDVLPRVLAEDAIGYGMLLLSDPDNEGLKRGKAVTHYNLGTMLTAERRWDEAAAQLAASIALRPEHGEAHNNLGVVFRAQGRLEDAIEEFRRALALDPSNEAARENLSDLLRSSVRQ